MSHRCGSTCRRRQKPSTRRDCPNCGSASRWLREPFEAGGQVRRMSATFRKSKAARRPEVTLTRVKQVLDHWIVQCKTEYREPGQPPSIGLSHWGWVEVDGARKAMQVVTSLDGGMVRSVYRNRNANARLQKGERDWFENRCLDAPIWRDESGVASV